VTKLSHQMRQSRAHGELIIKLIAAELTGAHLSQE